MFERQESDRGNGKEGMNAVRREYEITEAKANVNELEDILFQDL